MGSKLNEGYETKRASEMPGPGEYDLTSGKFVDSNMRREPNYRIGTAQRLGDHRSKNVKRVPGPANYNTIDASAHVHQQSPQYRFGSENRRGSYADKNSPERVGPGSYEPKHYVGNEGLKKSMSSKLSEFNLVQSRNLPGPGQYEVSGSA